MRQPSSTRPSLSATDSVRARRSAARRAFARATAAAVPDAVLFLGLALIAVTAGTPGAGWLRWLPLPLLTAAAAWFSAVGRRTGIGYAAAAGLVAAPLPALVFAGTALAGPLPAAGVVEAFDGAVATLGAIALWARAANRPVAAAAHWAGALGLAWLVGYWTGDSHAALRPSVALPGAGAVAAAALALGLAIHGRQSSLGPLAAPGRRGLRAVCLFALGAGAAAGWMLAQRDRPADPELAAALEAGRRAQETLWLRAVLTGWGGRAADRMIEVVADPDPARTPPWGGPAGFLARYGLWGVLLLLGWAGRAWIRTRRAMATPPPAHPALEAWSLPLSLAFAGWLVAGGPATPLVWWVWGGWAGLALAPTPEVEGARMRRGARWAAAATVCLTGGALAAALALPAAGQAMRRAAAGADPADAYRLLWRARTLDPYDPAIPTALAGALRHQMNTSPGWSESLYRRVVEYYRAARRLDPFDPLLAMRLAQFQLLCDRDDEALTTIREALGDRPRSPELIDYAIMTAIGRGRTREALAWLHEGLALDPAGPRAGPTHRGGWWLLRYELAQRQGLDAAAVRALSLALSAAPDDPARVQAAWRHLREPRTPAVQLGDRP